MVDIAADMVAMARLAPGPLRSEDAAAALGAEITHVEESGEALLAEGALVFHDGGFTPGPRIDDSEASPIRDTRLAVALAEALAARGADPGEVGLLFARAARWERARDPLAEAALGPAADGEHAALLAGLALEAESHVPGLDPAVRGRLHLARARHLRAIGRSHEAMDELDSAVHLLGGVERVDALGFATVVADDLQSPQWAETLAALAESEAWAAGEPAKAGSLLTLRARMLSRIGFPREADRVLEVGTELLDRHGHEIQRFYARLNRARIQLDRGEARNAESGFDRLRAEAGEIEGPLSQADKEVYWARAAFAVGRPAEALQAVERAEAAAAEHDAPVLAFLAGIARAEGALYFERHDEAVGAADRVLELALADLPAWVNRAHILRARALTGLGRLDEAADETAAALASTPAGVDGLRLRKEIEVIRLLALPPDAVWPKRDAENLTDELLQAQWHLPALQLMVERAHREDDEELALHAAGLALDLGLPTEAIWAADAADLWSDPAAQAVAYAAQGVVHHLPEPWAEQWTALPHVTAALAVEVAGDTAAAKELTARWAEVVEASGLAGFGVLSPAQRSALGLVRRGTPRPWRRRLMAVAGVMTVAAVVSVAVVLLLRPTGDEGTTTTGPIATVTLEETELPGLPESISGETIYRADSARSGVLPGDVTGPRQVDGYYWRQRGAGQITASPVTYGQWVFVAGTDHFVRAYEMRNGRLLWSYEASEALRATPAVGRFAAAGRGGAGGTQTVAVFGDDGGKVYFRDALDTVADPFWIYRVPGRVVGSPLIVDHRVIVVSSGPDSGQVTSLVLTSEDWTFSEYEGTPIGPVQGAPAYHDGIVYVTTTGVNGALYLLDIETGAPVCEPTPLGSLRLPPLIVDGVAYVSAEQVVYPIEAGECWGTPAHRLALYPFPGSGVTAAPLVVGDLMVVPSGPDLVAIDLTQPRGDTYVWRFEAGARIESSPVTADGVIYFGTDAGTVFAVPLYPDDPSDVRELWRWETGSPIRSSVTVVEGILFLTGTDGTITAIGPRSG